MSLMYWTIKDSIVSVGDKIEIIFADENGIAAYGSHVEDIKDNILIASNPEPVSGNSPPESNTNVTIRFNRPDAMYESTATFEWIDNDRAGRILLKSLSTAERVQRRDYVRISKKAELKYAILKSRAEDYMHNSLGWIDSITRNISAGGLLMRVDDDIEVGDILLVRFNDYNRMGIPDPVTSVCHRVAAYRKYCLGGMQFIAKGDLPNHFQPAEIEKLPPPAKRFDNHVRNNMIRYVFDEQVKERRRGVI